MKQRFSVHQSLGFQYINRYSKLGAAQVQSFNKPLCLIHAAISTNRAVVGRVFTHIVLSLPSLRRYLWCFQEEQNANNASIRHFDFPKGCNMTPQNIPKTTHSPLSLMNKVTWHWILDPGVSPFIV